MRKPEIVHLFIGKMEKICGFVIFLFSNLKVKDTNIERYPTNSNSAHPNFVKTSG